MSRFQSNKKQKVVNLQKIQYIWRLSSGINYKAKRLVTYSLNYTTYFNDIHANRSIKFDTILIQFEMLPTFRAVKPTAALEIMQDLQRNLIKNKN